MLWLYWLIIIFGIVNIIWGVVSVIKSKNKILAIKESVNMVFNPIAKFMWMHILTVFTILVVGILLIKENSTSVFLLDFADGFVVGIEILLFELIGLWFYDEYKSYKNKTKSVFQKWFEYIEINGVIRYTEEEKAIRKIEHDKSVLKMRSKFPKITQWYDKQKKVKDGTL